MRSSRSVVPVNSPPSADNYRQASRSSAFSSVVTASLGYIDRISPHLTVQATQQANSDTMRIECSVGVFRAVWITVTVSQLVTATVLTRGLYSFVWTLFDHDEIVTALKNFGLEWNGSVMFGTIAATACVVVFHLFGASRSILRSIQKRRLNFGVTESTTKVGPRTPTLRSIIAVSRRQRWMMSTTRQLRAVDSVASKFSVHGAYFHSAMYIREFFEVATQTYQLYRVSYTIDESWINLTALSIVVVNCWSTPFIDITLHHNEPLRRMMCLAVDIILDTVSSILLPFLVYATYRSKIPSMDWYNLLWIMDAGNELLFFHCNTWLDVFSRLLPAFGVAGCINGIQTLVVQSEHSNAVVAVMPEASRSIPKSGNASTNPPLRRRCRVALIHVVFIVYGIVVTVFSIIAHNGPHLSPVLRGCQKSTRPWVGITDKYPCSILEINCAGDQSKDMESRLEQALPSSLSALVFAHCENMSVPHRISSFRDLLWLEFYNSSIISWPDESALTASKFPRLSRLLLVRSNLQGLPSHVIQNRIFGGASSMAHPQTLKNIAVVATDLSMLLSLPPNKDLVSSHRHLDVLLLEWCELSSIPPILESYEFQVDTLSLVGNNISNPFTLTISAPRELHVESTTVDSCSSAIGVSKNDSTQAIFAFNSPLCSKSVEERQRLCTSVGSVNCDETRSTAVFPLADHDRRRAYVPPDPTA